MRDGSFTSTPWCDIRVGDILKVKRNEQVPADAVFLASYAADSDTPDTCYVQTAQLDGETNLKLRAAVNASAEHFKSDAHCANFKGSIKCEAPNAAFDKFVGLLQMSTSPEVNGSINSASAPAARGIPLEAEQLLLRGVYLRNVDYAYAIVVYTGRETKVRVRQSSRPTKRAQVESELNRLILCLIGLLITLCLVGTVGHVLWTDQAFQGQWYFGETHSRISTRVGVLHFLTFFLLNASFIPISLYVSVRLARSLQMIFMEADLEMVHEDAALLKSSRGEEGRFPFKVRSMELNDELGQITHIFSDKTGTLTLNYMEWRKILVNGVSHGLGTTQIGIDRLRREGKDVSHLNEALAAEKLRGHERGAQLPHVNFEDGSDSHPGRTIGSDSRNPSDGGQGTAIHDLLLNLCLNHTVLPEVVRDTSDAIIGTRLSASSPDEEAFCYAAETLGYKFVSRTHEGILLKIRHAPSLLPLRRATAPISEKNKAASALLGGGVRMSDAAGYPGTEYPFRVLNVLAYSQERKRMSVIVEHPVVNTDGTVHVCADGESGEIYLYCKGADSVIIPRCSEPRSPAEKDALEQTKATLASWGGDGLRTLVFAQRRLTREEYALWAHQYDAACTDLEEIRKRKDKRANAIEDLQASIETGLTLQGAMANEDKLQPEVPETIALLAKAGIKIWMVTGDKQETAVNIGFATKLLTETQRQIVATMESAGGVNAAMRRMRIAAKRMRAERAAAAASNRDAASQAHASTIMQWALGEMEVFARLGMSSPQQPSLRESGTSSSVRPDPSDIGIPSSTSAMRQIRLASPRSDGADPDFESDAEEEAIAAGDGTAASMAFGHQASANDIASIPPTPQLTASAAPVAAASSHSVFGNPAHPSNMARAASCRDVSIAVSSSGTNRPFALIIDEHCLDAALQSPRAKAYLLYVAINCDAVIACRARPDQKAQVVRLIRNGVSTSRTLAVGDGANDVDMISTAHVGVGIAGAEGVQAANASDFSIGRFRFLQRLLLVHGRYNYSRMTRLVLYMFWKNVMFVVCQFLYQTINGFSGQKWYVEFAAQVYNIVFTGLPTLVMAVLDRDIDSAWALRFPKLYDHGRLARGLSSRTFLLWMSDAVILSALFFCLSMYGYAVPDGLAYPSQGGASFVFQLGTVAYTMVILSASIRIAVETFQHSNILQASIAASAILWVPACFVFDAMRQDGMHGGMQYIFSSVNFYLVVLLAGGAMGLRLIAWKAYKRFYEPDLRHIIQEVAAITGDATSAEKFTDAADLARRTGKSLAEVIKADRIAAAAAEIIAPMATTNFRGRVTEANMNSSGTASQYLTLSPIKGDKPGAEYGVLSGGDTPESIQRRRLLAAADGSSNISTYNPSSYLKTPDQQARSDLIDETRRVILEKTMLPRMTVNSGDTDEFDSERPSDAPITPLSLSPPALRQAKGPSELGESVVIEDMKARLAAGMQRLEQVPRSDISGAGAIPAGSVSSIARTWPPGTHIDS